MQENIQENMQNMEEYMKRYAEYEEAISFHNHGICQKMRVNPISICRICTPDFADVEGEARRRRCNLRTWEVQSPSRAGRPLKQRVRLAAKTWTGHSKIQKWCVTEFVWNGEIKNRSSFFNPVDRPVDRPVDATFLKNLKEFLVANAALDTTPTRTQCKAVPFRYSRAFWAGRSSGLSRLCLPV